MTDEIEQPERSMRLKSDFAPHVEPCANYHTDNPANWKEGVFGNMSERTIDSEIGSLPKERCGIIAHRGRKSPFFLKADLSRYEILGTWHIMLPKATRTKPYLSHVAFRGSALSLTRDGAPHYCKQRKLPEPLGCDVNPT